MTLDLLICTIDSGIDRVESLLLPPITGVRYVVAWQHTLPTPPQAPAWTSRPDVLLHAWQGHGLSANRNVALSLTQADVALMLDDDCRLTAQALQQFMLLAAAHPEVDIFALRMTDLDGHPLKTYPTQSFDLSHPPRGYYPSSCELAVRPHSALPRFDERFGLGAPHLACGEEEVFILQALRRRLHVVYFPLTITATPAGTTGRRFATSVGVRQAKGAVLCLKHGPVGAALRCFKFALHHPPIVQHFCDMLRGILLVR